MANKTSLFIELRTNEDGKTIWQAIEAYGVNLMDYNSDKIVIYGDVELRVALVIVDMVAKYGKVRCTLST